MTLNEQKLAAKAFAESWKGRGDEKQETQKFWIELLHDVFGVANPTSAMEFEKKVKLEGSIRFIDVYIPETRVIVEQKSVGIDLSKEGNQSGGDNLTPYNQARRYDNNLPVSEKARWIVCCNFERFEIHDMQNPLENPEVVLLKDLDKDFTKLQVIADVKAENIRREEEISFKAGKLVGELYDMILPQYRDPNNADTLRSLNQLCVRLVFCLYAEDTGLFGEKDKFYNYLKEFNPGQFRKALIELFKVFDTAYEERDAYMDPALASFPYIKGGLFTDDIEIPLFTPEIIEKLLVKASLEVDWSDISPTIFGAVFESTLNPETRRSGGMHYTSVENIHKVIDPLFLNELKDELNDALEKPVRTSKDKKDRALVLAAFQNKLASLKFLDPACGSGNFLTESYLSIRRLENIVIKELFGEGMFYFGEEFSPIKVKIDQFFGIEINDFAVSVARTALWIAEAQTLKETEHIVSKPIEYFPLKENPNIVEANALRIDWNDVVSANEVNYIMGNPPFVGYSLQSKEQKADILSVYVDEKGKPYSTAGKIDYVAGWYWKASEMMASTDNVIRTALVSTNSITQGEQVANIWKPLFDRFGIHIDFAWRTFRWDSEANEKAHVHCVIIGISCSPNNSKRCIFDGKIKEDVDNINAYLLGGSNIFVSSSTKPISKTLVMLSGNRPSDDGQLLLSPEERNTLLSSYPQASPFVKRFMMGYEFINNVERYCLWLVDASPSFIKNCRIISDRISKCKEARLASTDKGRNKLAYTPHLMREQLCPSSYIALPKVSSEHRKYIPLGYLDEQVIPGDKLFVIPEASLYMFGILTSIVHMAWMRVVCGRLEMRYSYSINIVYNNFPWPTPTDTQKAKIEETAQAILDARALYPDCSLADLYDKLTMPIELRKAHQTNDKAVMEAYGFRKDMSESEIVAELFKMYQKLTEK